MCQYSRQPLHLQRITCTGGFGQGSLHYSFLASTLNQITPLEDFQCFLPSILQDLPTVGVLHKVRGSI
jgi:hypothetical protein